MKPVSEPTKKESMKLSSKIGHFMGFHGRVQDWLKTNEWDVECNLLGCWRVEVYKCPKCHREIKATIEDYLSLYRDEFMMELKIKVAKANADIGDYKTATEVLKI